MGSGRASVHAARGRMGELLADPSSRIHPERLKPGHSLPDLASLVAYDREAPDAEALLKQRHGLTLFFQRWTWQPPCSLPRCGSSWCTVRLNGAGWRIVPGRNAAVAGEIATGEETVVAIAEPPRRELSLRLNPRDRRVRFYWGYGSSSGGFKTFVKGDDVAVVVADTCMLSWGSGPPPFTCT